MVHASKYDPSMSVCLGYLFTQRASTKKFVPTPEPLPFPHSADRTVVQGATSSTMTQNEISVRHKTSPARSSPKLKSPRQSTDYRYLNMSPQTRNLLQLSPPLDHIPEVPAATRRCHVSTPTALRSSVKAHSLAAVRTLSSIDVTPQVTVRQKVPPAVKPQSSIAVDTYRAMTSPARSLPQSFSVSSKEIPLQHKIC